MPHDTLRRLLCHTLPAVLWLWPALAAMAQHDAATDTLRSRQLSEAHVAATRRPARDLLPVQTLGRDGIERLSAHSVADAIRYFSGVQVKDYGGIGGLKTVNLRSLGTHHVGVFYDGIELGNAQNGQIDLGRFSLDNLEAISVYNGQRSAIFASAKDFGSAGSVYLQSRTPRLTDRRRQLRGRLRTGSFGTVNPSMLWEERLSPRLTASASAEWTQTNGRYRFRYRTTGGYDTTALRRNGDVSALRAEAGLYGTTGRGDWRAKAYAYRSGRGLPGAVVRNKLSHEDRQWDTNLFLQGSFQQQLAARSRLRLAAKLAHDYLHYLSDPSRDEALMYTDNRYHQTEAYVSAAHLFTPDSHWSLSAAADYQWNRLEADLYNFARPDRHTLLAVAAAAADYGRLKAQASVLATLVADRTRRSGAATMDRRTRLTPTLVLSYQPRRTPGLALRAFYKDIFRMPTLNDLYYTFIGNVALRPECTRQYDAGLAYTLHPARRHWLRRLEFQADVYHNRVSDKIVAVPTSNQFRWTMMNLGRVRILGADVSAQTAWALPAGVTGSLQCSYTFQQAQDRTDPLDAFYGDQIPYVPRHSGSVTASLGWRRWELGYSFICTGSRYDQRANIPENYAPEWYTSDLRLAYGWTLRRAACHVAGELNNLFNQQFEVVKGYPMPGTNFRITLTITI